MLEGTVGGHLVQPCAESKANFEVRLGCSGFCPVENSNYPLWIKQTQFSTSSHTLCAEAHNYLGPLC